FTGGRDIPYFLVPALGPVVGAALGAFGYRQLIGRHFPCDPCAPEAGKTSSSRRQQKASL
ncbi:aquaporin, partial [Cronobacter sakazakii]